MELKDLKDGVWLQHKAAQWVRKVSAVQIRSVRLWKPNGELCSVNIDAVLDQFELWRPEAKDMVIGNDRLRKDIIFEISEIEDRPSGIVYFRDDGQNGFYLHELEPYIEKNESVEQPEYKFKEGNEVVVSKTEAGIPDKPFKCIVRQVPTSYNKYLVSANTSHIINGEHFSEGAYHFVKPEHMQLIPKEKFTCLDLDETNQMIEDNIVAIKQAALDKEHSDPYDYGKKMDEMQAEGHFTQRMTGGRYGLLGSHGGI